ncbi:MAG: MG2 domain-containing protein [Planctomycetota bacterium]|jgi:TolA-binding protein
MRVSVPGRTALFVVFLLVTAGFVLVQDGLKKGEDLLIQRKYREAATQLEKALSDAPAAERDRVLLLLGRARWLAGDVAGAVRAYERLVRNHGGSTLVHKARFQQAEALASRGDYRAAAPIYRAEIERLVGLSRKEEIATTYLGLAEKALAKTPPDYNRAVTFFDLALDLGMSKDRERSVKLQAAEARLKSRNYRDAIRRFTPLAKKLTIEQGRLRAMLGLGRARSRAGDRAGARTVLRDVIAAAKTSKEAADAAYEIAVSYGVPRPTPRDLDRAVAALADLARSYPDQQQAKVALFLTARCYQHVGRSEDALKALRAFLDEDHAPDLKEVPLAREMVGDVLAGQGKLTEAIKAWRTYLSSHPSHKDWERVQRSIVDTEYRMADAAFAKGKKEFGKARRLFTAFARAYPIDYRNPQILFLMGEMLFQEEKYDLAREAFERCVSKYPGKQASSHAQFRIGEIYESKTFNYLDALKAYQKVTWGSWVAKAKQRIARLTKKSLGLVTKRTYRTGEKATFKLTSRNMEKVRVRVFRLDLETYFRATHTAGSVDRLDIEVIEPDKTFDSAVEKYVKYQETERQVDIGFRKAGAYVVKVDDRELEATTMVLITDVALIAKSSRHEFFVFGQNLKENRVEAGIKVVLSNGKKVIAEGVTDATGVWRYKGKELKSNDQLRVFAINAAGSGASNINLSGMGYSQGLTPKCYLFTDRPVYQPGQLVHIKGVMREVRDGIYRLPSKEGYRLQVFGASGRMVLQRQIRFTQFGSFAADVVLPPQAVLGQWRIRVDQGPRSSQSFGGGFRVARYERPRLSLTADLDKRVVFRGEVIKGRLKLRYFFGEPAVGKSVQYALRLPDGGLIQREGVTNAAGELAFEFPTKDFGEEAVARIDARMATENVATTVLVPVVTTEFTPTLSIVRSVYLAGEPFDVSVVIKDRAGKPLARKGRVRLFRRERQGKAVVEVEVLDKDFQTDAKDGKGRVTFQAKKGGDYVARVEATDRFGTVVSAQLNLKVSGEDDKIKLRLLSDRQFYKVGDTLKVKVANRAGDRLVLRTIQGDGILVYDSVMLKKGESTIEFQLEPLHAPNFGLALSMIDGTALRTAQREFRVSRDLHITVEPGKAVARPGEEVEISIKATDPKGRPVQAEVALSLVDEALLASYPDRNPKMGAFFYGQMRETGFRTVSSCTWSYKGGSRKMSRELLAEERRLKEEAEKAEGPPTGGGTDDFFARHGRNAAPTTPGAPAPSRENRVADRRTQQDRPGSRFANDMDKDAQPSEQAGQTAGVGGGAGGKLRQRAGEGKSRMIQDYLKRLEQQQSQLAVNGIQLAHADPGAELNQPRTDFSETGAWISAVVTGRDGKSKVKVKLPDSTTGFSVVARGATKDTYVGEGKSVLRTAKKLQVSVLAPPTLTEGDRTKATAHVHNLSGERLRVGLKLSANQGGKVTELDRGADFQKGQEREFPWDLTAGSAADIRLEAAATGGDHTDALKGGIVVRPFGMEYRDGRSGHTTQGASFKLGLPRGREFTRLSMQLQIGRDPGRDLVAAALGQGYRPYNCRRVDSTNLSLSSRGIAALLVLDYLEEVRRSTPADAARLRGLAASCLSRLVQSQAADGGMAWIGKRHSDLRTTSQVVRFLQMAKQRGMASASAPLNKSQEWLLRRMRRARMQDRCRLALALARRVGFSTLNGLHRSRASLDAESLSYLALAWHELGRKSLANEVLTELRKKLNLRGRKNTAQVEVIGLAATALLKSDPRDALGLSALEWLKAKRWGASWGTPEATAAALWALTTSGGFGDAAGSHAEVKILVNGKELATVPASVKETNARFDVPPDWLTERGNQVDIKVSGRGNVYYSASMTGFAVGFRREDRRRSIVEINRKYLPAFLRHNGKVLQPGFGIVTGRNYRTFENKLTKLAVGQTGRVEVGFWTRDPHRRHISPLVVEEPIPAGCTVPKDSIRGSYDHMVVEPDRMTFYFREGITSGSIYYEIQARFEGKYRVLPTKAYGALRPDLLAHGATRTFTVLP